MKHEMAITKNIKRFIGAVRRLQDRPAAIEGMGLLWGGPGEGKTTSIAYVVNLFDGAFVRANACWSVTSLLAALAVELGVPVHRYTAPMLRGIKDSLMDRPRPLFVDEADYIVRQQIQMDTLRDIYDDTGSPVILVGMERMATKIQTSGRFARRITEWIKFQGIEEGETKILAETICEIPVHADLLTHIWEQSRANIGRMCTALARVESFGRLNGIGPDDPGGVTLEMWGDNQLFFDQPRFGGRR